ncbi:MAG: hypothetical protein R3259_07025 [Salinimicrobium sediminis]|nr:hypothetical protein [Salinimicrobium sediminis]
MIIKTKVPKKAFLKLLILLLLLQSCGKSGDGLISSALSSSEIDWISEKTQNLILYAPEDSYAAENLAELKIQAETARQQVMERLQVVKQEAAPSLLFLESREEMQEFTGIAAGGRTVVEENGAFFTMNDAVNPPLRHELGHLYSWRSWGPPAGYWLSEGVAVYAAGDCKSEELHAWAAKLTLENKLQDFSLLEQDLDFSSAAAHLQAGSFIKYVMEKYGVRSFRLIWEEGLSASSEATGLEMDALLDQWTGHIMQKEFTAAAQFLDLDTKISCE